MDGEAFCPWEQQATEEGPEWAYFVAYRDQGPQRTLVEAGRIVGMKKAYATYLARKNNWDARVRAWDAEVDRIRRLKFLAEQRRLIKIHARNAGIVRRKAMKAIRSIGIEELASNPKVALDYLQAATKMETQSCGLPTEVTSLSLQNGQTADTRDVYFDSLPDDKLLDIVQMSLDTLKKDKREMPCATAESTIEPPVYPAKNSDPAATENEN